MINFSFRWNHLRKMNDNLAELKEVIVLLNKIERTYALERSKTIGLLQNMIWDAPALKMMRFIFCRNLQDLNFYEPIERDRDTALGYYDDKQLLRIPGKAKKQIQSLLPPDN